MTRRLIARAAYAPSAALGVNTDWRRRSACQQEDPELFFAGGTSAAEVQRTEQALLVCADCPVRKVCLDWALSSGQEFGVWGGTDEDERRRIKRRAASERARNAA